MGIADAPAATTSAYRLDFGTVYVNSHLAIASEVPWGGLGSGYSRDLAIYSPNDFSRVKHVQINHTR